MNIVFYHTEAADLSPLYEDKIPLEAAEFSGHSVFREVRETVKEFFPDARLFLWSGSGPAAAGGTADPGLEVLSVPTREPFAMVFFFSAFSAAEGLNSLTLYYPAHLILRPFESFAVAFRKVMASPMLSTAFTFFSARSGGHPVYLQTGDCVMRDGDQSVHHVLDFRPASDVTLWKEKHPETSEWDSFLGGADLFSVNRTAFTEALEDASDTLKNLYFSLSDPLSDGSDPVAIAELERYDFRDILKGRESVLATGLAAEFDRTERLEDLFRFLPLDENGNFTEGARELESVSKSIVINRDAAPVRLENATGLFYAQKDGKSRVRGLSV